jgi:hypothetical protein
MEVRMPRQFGLRARLSVAPSISATPCKSEPKLLALVPDQTMDLAADAGAQELMFSSLALPYAPASWRGSGNRRSVSMS